MSDTTSLSEISQPAVQSNSFVQSVQSTNGVASGVASSGLREGLRQMEQRKPSFPPPPNPQMKQAVQMDGELDVDPVIMNKVINDVQKQSQREGDHTLRPPQRNIPTEPHMESLMQDASAHPTRLPSEPSYSLPFMDSANKIVGSLGKKKNKELSLHSMFEMLQLPILMALLYFLFQLPIVRTNLRQYLPFTYQEDGTLSLVGFVVHSSIFGVAAFIINYTQDYCLSLLQSQTIVQ
tara:strand:- start:133 stop:840 length:708 start_codon:yes stop_codon:yes gene_type:complete